MLVIYVVSCRIILVKLLLMLGGLFVSNVVILVCWCISLRMIGSLGLQIGINPIVHLCPQNTHYFILTLGWLLSKHYLRPRVISRVTYDSI